MKDKVISLAKDILSHPTAPYREHRIRQYIIDFCKMRKIKVKQDDVGNLVVTYGSHYKNTVFAFAAHMDHPGFIIEKDSVRKRTTALFYGGVAEKFFKHSTVKIFTQNGPVKAKVTRTLFDLKKRLKKVWLKQDGDVQQGDIGMWDLPACQIRGDRLYSRACDDLVGCISILVLLDELTRRKIRKKVQAVFSVAEEGGLHGAKHLCLTKKIPKRTNIIAIETSSVVPAVKMGDGVVIRVGDRSSLFTPALTGFLLDAAKRAQSIDKAFKYQRKLMDAGVCESTVYNRFGYTNAAVCIPLGNYHNQNQRTQKIASEYVSIDDLENMVKLFLLIVRKSEKVGCFLKNNPPTYKHSKGNLGEFFYY